MKRNKIFPLLGILTGIVAIVFAIVLFSGGAEVGDKDTGEYVSHEYYGGDAYTGIQQAAADTANNVRALSRIARSGFGGLYGASSGFILLILGLAVIAFSLCALDECKVRDHFEQEVLNALNRQGTPAPAAEDRKAEDIPVSAAPAEVSAEEAAESGDAPEAIAEEENAESAEAPEDSTAEEN